MKLLEKLHKEDFVKISAYKDIKNFKQIWINGIRHDDNLYIIFNHFNRYYKIGISQNPYERIRTISTAAGINMEVIFIIELEPGDITASSLERFMHKQFHDKRIIGEWFNLNYNDLCMIQSVLWEIEGFDIVDNLAFHLQD